MARIADDSDFEALKRLVDNHDGWTLELSKSDTQVYTRPVPGCNFNMVKIHTEFTDVTADTVFDVLHDPDYRKVWDSHMLASEEIGILNVNNDVGYYAMSCPPPLKPRDFVLQRSWLDTGPHGEQMLLSRSVPHKHYPPKKGYVRAMSYITGFVLRTDAHLKTGCTLKYVAHCDPQGTLPPWLVNKVTHTLGPRMVKDLKKAALGYVSWKQTQPHLRKPWRYPEEIRCPRISIEDCLDQCDASAMALVPTTSTVTPRQPLPNSNPQPSQQQQPSTPTQRKLPQLKTQTNGRVLPILHKKAQSTPSSPIVEDTKFLKRDELLKLRLAEQLEKEEKRKQSGKEASSPKTNGTSKEDAARESPKSIKELEKEAKAAAKESKKASKAAAKEAEALAKREKKEKGLTKRRSLLNLKF